MNTDPGKLFDIKTNKEWRHLGVTAENWRPHPLNPEKIPEGLHDLIPLARRWGISCDVTRHDAAEKASKSELDEVARLLRGRHTQIYRWLYTLDIPQPDEASAFQALLIFEAEEAEGPGIPGLLDWRIQEFKRDSCDQNLTLLRQAYDYINSWSPLLKSIQPLAEAKALLNIRTP